VGIRRAATLLTVLGLHACDDPPAAAPDAGPPEGLCAECRRAADCPEGLRCRFNRCLDPAHPEACDEPEEDAGPRRDADTGPPPGACAEWEVKEGWEPLPPPCGNRLTQALGEEEEGDDGEGEVPGWPPAGGDMLSWPDGVSLGLVLRGIDPESEAPAAAPVVHIYPRTGRLSNPIAIRLCIEDDNGYGDIDGDQVEVRVAGRERLSEILWIPTRPTRICGQLQHPYESTARGWDELEGGPITVEARAADHGGLSGTDSVTWTLVPAPEVRFKGVTVPAGLGGYSFFGNNHDGGVAFVDLNGDDHPEVFFTNGAGRSNKLYWNRCDGTFEDVTDRTPVGKAGFEFSSVVFSDIDNDGDDDLYVLGDHPVLKLEAMGGGFDDNPVPGHPNFLFRNEGGRCLTDGTWDAHLEDLSPDATPFRSGSGAFADYDLDGCIDVVVGHRRIGGHDPVWDPDRLYRNDCTGRFTDVTDEAGVDDYLRDALGVLFEDLNGDRYPDIYLVHTAGVANSRRTQPDAMGRMASEVGDDILYLNNGDGTFSDVTHDVGVGTHAFAGMGGAVGDYDGDGDMDLYLTDLSEPLSLGNAMYRNLQAETGEFRFEEVCFELGSRPLCGEFSFGTVFADFDLDGNVDLFHGGADGRWIYMGNGEGDFHAPVGPNYARYDDRASGVPAMQDVRGAAAADFDRDGDVDLVVMQEDTVESNTPSILLRNDTPRNGRHWLEVKLVATRSNRTAIGARVDAWPEGKDGPRLVRQVSGGHSTFSQSEKIVHLGLGAWERVEVLEVRWPLAGSPVQTLTDVEADQLLVVTEP